MVDNITDKDKYNACILLHALGDTIGFKNGDWEFNFFVYERLMSLDYTNEMIYEFIQLGGVNGIDLSGWRISDDTMFHLAIGQSMLQYKGKVDKKFIELVKNNMKETLIEALSDKRHKDPDKKIDRYVGTTTLESIKEFKDNYDARNSEYNDYAGGNGCAMRNLVIGLCLYGKKNRDKLIDVSIITSQLTHNNPIGYLAGFNSALFTALAIEGEPIETWPYILIDYLKSDKLKSFLSLENLEQSYDHTTYIKYWQKYIDTKFDNKKPIRNKSFANPMYRIRYYHDNFHESTGSKQIGASGYLCMIMAYDSLLDCDGKWEKLIVYSILHSGDSDTIGAIAGGLYGTIYGMGDVPQHMLKHLEKKNELIELSKNIYKEYH